MLFWSRSNRTLHIRCCPQIANPQHADVESGTSRTPTPTSDSVFAFTCSLAHRDLGRDGDG